MSKLTRANRCKEHYQQFIALDPLTRLTSLPNTFSDFDGLSLDEAIQTWRAIAPTLEIVNSKDMWSRFSWHALTTLESLLQQCTTFGNQLFNANDQNSFQNFNQNLDSLAYHLKLYGADALVFDIEQLNTERASLVDSSGKLKSQLASVEKLEGEVRALIAPAVAGSLSNSFTARKDVLLWGRIAWGIVALLVGILSIWATYGFADAVSEAFKVSQRPQTSATELLWLSVIVRSVILLPIYAAFGFSFSQYKKERDFEEEYAHKAAVAASLPNYGDLTREPSVRDQIVTGATNVIFSSPTAKNKANTNDPTKALDGLKEVVDSIAKLVPRKTD